MKFIKRFKSLIDANVQGASGLFSPNVNTIDTKKRANMIKLIVRCSLVSLIIMV